jgi:DNA-binding CsgD family transcriptional regulator
VLDDRDDRGTHNEQQGGPDRARIIAHVAARQSNDQRLLLAAHALTWMMRTAPAALGLFYSVDRRMVKFSGDVVVATGANARSMDPAALLEQYRREHQRSDPLSPRALTPGSLVVVDLAEMPERGPRNRWTYLHQFLHGHGFVGQTTIVLRSAGRIVAGVDLLRSGHDPHPGIEGLKLLRAGHGLLQETYGWVQAPLAAQPELAEPALAKLSRREADVARLVVGGASNRETAIALGISESTVKSHLLHVFEKLQVRSRAQLSLVMRPQIEAERLPAPAAAEVNLDMLRRPQGITQLRSPPDHQPAHSAPHLDAS